MTLDTQSIDELQEHNRLRNRQAYELLDYASNRIAHDSAELHDQYRNVCDPPSMLERRYWRSANQPTLQRGRRVERSYTEMVRASGVDDPLLRMGNRLDAVRMSLPEEHLRNVNRLPVPPAIQFSAAVHNTGLPEVPINPFPPPASLPAVPAADGNYVLRMDLAHEIASKRLRSEEEIVRWLIGRNPIDLGPAVTLLDASSSTPLARPMIMRFGALVQDNRHPLNLLTITEPNARAIAKSYKDMLTPYTEIERILSDGGVSRLNVLTALDMLEQIAQDQPGELPDILRELQGTTVETAQSAVEQLQAKKRLSATLHSLGSIPSGYAENLSFGEINRELEFLQLDLQNLSDERDHFIAGNPVSLGRTFRSTLLTRDRRMTGDIRNYIQDHTHAYDPRAYERIADTIQGRTERLFKGQEYMSSVSDKLEAIFEQVKKSGLKGSATLNNLVDSTGKVIQNKLNVSSGRTSLAEKLADELKVGSEVEIDKEIAEKKEAEVKAKKGGDRKRGYEAVKLVYRKALRLNGVPGDIPAIAEAMAEKNEMGFQERELMMKMLNDTEVVGEKEHFSHKLGRQFTQLATGSQEEVVVNLAEALGVKRNHGTWAPLSMQSVLDRNFPGLGFGRGTRFMWFMPKPNARPAWGELGFEKLMIAFFALRKATKDSPQVLANSPYIERMREEIGEQIATRFTERLLKDLSDIDQNEKKEDGTIDTSNSEEQLAFHNARKQRALLKLFGADAAGKYEGKASEYLQIAQNRTATWRRATGRTIKKTVVGAWNTGKKAVTKTATGIGKSVSWIASRPKALYGWLRSPW